MHDCLDDKNKSPNVIRKYWAMCFYLEELVYSAMQPQGLWQNWRIDDASLQALGLRRPSVLCLRTLLQRQHGFFARARVAAVNAIRSSHGDSIKSVVLPKSHSSKQALCLSSAETVTNRLLPRRRGFLSVIRWRPTRKTPETHFSIERFRDKRCNST